MKLKDLLPYLLLALVADLSAARVLSLYRVDGNDANDSTQSKVKPSRKVIPGVRTLYGADDQSRQQREVYRSEEAKLVQERRAMFFRNLVFGSMSMSLSMEQPEMEQPEMEQPDTEQSDTEQPEKDFEVVIPAYCTAGYHAEGHSTGEFADLCKKLLRLGHNAVTQGLLKRTSAQEELSSQQEQGLMASVGHDEEKKGLVDLDRLELRKTNALTKTIGGYQAAGYHAEGHTTEDFANLCRKLLSLGRNAVKQGLVKRPISAQEELSSQQGIQVYHASGHPEDDYANLRAKLLGLGRDQQQQGLMASVGHDEEKKSSVDLDRLEVPKANSLTYTKEQATKTIGGNQADAYHAEGYTSQDFADLRMKLLSLGNNGSTQSPARLGTHPKHRATHED